jgi:hypothetical protein
VLKGFTMRHILLFVFVVVFCGSASCGNRPSPVGPVLNAAVDCLGANRARIDTLVNEFKGPILGGGAVSWPDVKVRATQAGKSVGGCFIMELTQWFLSGTRAVPDATLAHDTAEEFRRTVGEGAVYMTTCTREDGTKNACKL